MFGGILEVLKELKVGEVIISKQGKIDNNYKEFLDIVIDKKIKVRVVKLGEKVKIDNHISIDILWPTEKLIQQNILNNNSIVMKLNYNKFSILFTGDIEEIAEREILKEYKINLQILNSSVLKVGHHGSKTSSTKEFLEAISHK